MNLPCTIGIQKEESCHLTTYVKTKGVVSIEPLDYETRELLLWRSGLTIININAQICYHHKYMLEKRFPLQQKSCCNPFDLHTTTRKGSLREIDVTTAKKLCEIEKPVTPGQKLCPKCREYLKDYENKDIEEDVDSFTEESDINEDFNEALLLNSSRQSLNATLNELELSPLKLHSLPKTSKITHGKRKLEQIQEAAQKKIATVLAVESEQITTEIEDVSNNKIIKTKADDLDHLVDCMKEKLKTANSREKLQILTLVPQSWSIRKAVNIFGVSKTTIQKAKELKKERGIVSLPDSSFRNKMSFALRNDVKEFYINDENSRQLPGKKDFVSVAKNQHVQKRLLLCNIKELYCLFKEKNSDKIISFSKFAALRPKWCVPVGPKGTHNVCVCTHHQNVSLLLNAIGLEHLYHSLIDMIVCDRNSTTCMIHRCEECPGIESVSNYLVDDVFKDDFDDENFNVVFQQWVTTDRSNLIQQTLPANEFVTLLCKKLDAITSHSYIAKHQSQYLQTLKENLPQNEIIVLGDFAENYRFVVQDEVQGYHWNSQQCTLHPIVVYFKLGETLTSKSLCLISDDLTHDVSFVYKVIAETLKFVKENISNTLTKVHYFSDGCAGQYKNKHHFKNLCLHHSEFALQCVWNFFATSHGKSPCDGIGGTVKRLTARASLQRPVTDQILNANQMFKFCLDNISGIHFIMVLYTEINEIRNSLTERFDQIKTVPGTRSYHQYVPIDENTIGCKRVSADADFDLEFKLNSKVIINQEVNVSSYIICQYDNLYWMGIVVDKDQVNNDAKIKFMHPNYPSASYHWPSRDDECWVPLEKVITSVSPPSLTTTRGRQYQFSMIDLQIISDILQ